MEKDTYYPKEWPKEYSWKLQPYQQELIDFFSSVPEGYELKRWYGGRRTYWLAIPKDTIKPTLTWKGGKWVTFGPTIPTNPILLKGFECQAIILDEYTFEQEYNGKPFDK